MSITTTTAAKVFVHGLVRLFGVCVMAQRSTTGTDAILGYLFHFLLRVEISIRGIFSSVQSWHDHSFYNYSLSFSFSFSHSLSSLSFYSNLSSAGCHSGCCSVPIHRPTKRCEGRNPIQQIRDSPKRSSTNCDGGGSFVVVDEACPGGRPVLFECC